MLKKLVNTFINKKLYALLLLIYLYMLYIFKILVVIN